MRRAFTSNGVRICAFLPAFWGVAPPREAIGVMYECDIDSYLIKGHSRCWCWKSLMTFLRQVKLCRIKPRYVDQ
jgi:hypothetical protein